MQFCKKVGERCTVVCVRASCHSAHCKAGVAELTETIGKCVTSVFAEWENQTGETFKFTKFTY